ASCVGIVVQPLAIGDFAHISPHAAALLRRSSEDTGTTVDTADDEFGYRWIILGDEDFEDLVVSLNTVSSQLQSGGYGDRVLCAVFKFSEKGRPLYFIYNYKRGSFYPFVPSGKQSRDNERELQLKAQVGSELPLEAELSRWFPLWEIPL
ncbi:MAG: PspA-associated protein PspAB, partial [Thermoleophilaceae bacterium]